MCVNDSAKLINFLTPLGDESREKALWLREFVWDLYPDANELIYDNYNAVAFGWSPTEKPGHTFCSIAVGRTSKNVHFGFYRGAALNDPENILLGEGNQYRYILVKDKKDFPAEYIKKLLKEAYNNSIAMVKDSNLLTIKGKTIVKSISPVKREKKNK
jgi:hypothetical protein